MKMTVLAEIDLTDGVIHNVSLNLNSAGGTPQEMGTAYGGVMLALFESFERCKQIAPLEIQLAFQEVTKLPEHDVLSRIKEL